MSGAVEFDWGQELPRLEGKRVALRWLAADDVPALYAIFGNAEVTRYWSWPAYESQDQAASLLASIHKHFHDRGLFQWGIEERASGGIIGTTTLFKLDTTHRRAEIGYALARDRWGHGYAQEALSILFNFAFTRLDLHRIEADVDPRNAASLRLLDRLGFTREGQLRERFHVNGEIQDSAICGMLRREWRASSAETAPTGVDRPAPPGS